MSKSLTMSDYIETEKIRTHDAKIFVECTNGKPYFSIKWFDNEKQEYCLGYSSYEIKNVLFWLDECFEIVNNPMTNADSRKEQRMRVEMVIHGRPTTKKNSPRIVMANGRPMVLPSKQYTDYEQRAGWEVKGKGLHINRPVNVRAIYYMPTRRRVDLCNLLEATCDILVKYDVLADDNSNIVASHDGSRVLLDRENPRAEIVIEDVI